MKTYSHDAVGYTIDGEVWECNLCGKKIGEHSWITLDRTRAVKCSEEKKGLTGYGTGV